MPQEEEGCLDFRYSFRFADGSAHVFDVKLDHRRLCLPSPETALPGWTELSFHQCRHCPLPAVKAARCPVALSLLPVIEAFGDKKSYEGVQMTVEGQARTYSKPNSLQNALSALLGLMMATAGCPVLDPLRPMADHPHRATRPQLGHGLMQGLAAVHGAAQAAPQLVTIRLHEQRAPFERRQHLGTRGVHDRGTRRPRQQVAVELNRCPGGQ